jgi:ribonucleoside-diphosphate reductase alpha chain
MESQFLNEIIKNKNLLNSKYKVIKRNGSSVPLDYEKISKMVLRAIPSIDTKIRYEALNNIINEFQKSLYDGISTDNIEKSLILASTVFIELDPLYDKISARLLLNKAIKNATGKSTNNQTYIQDYQQAFIKGIQEGVKNNIFDKRLLNYDLQHLATNLDLERDYLFGYMGLYTLFERYFYKINNKRVETPQAYWMRIAMGIALAEKEPEKYVLEFYNIISQFKYIPSTPTLFHSGYIHSQLSSCFVNIVEDDLNEIFKFIGDNAQISKWAGGLGGSWSKIRGLGANIKKLNSTSQGIIPFIKIFNDMVLAITKGGIRRGGACIYLEPWHIDIEDFLDLKRNTGDERRRAHDINTALWVPDLFMQRVLNDQDWLLISPDEAPDLHETYGKEFNRIYEHYENQAKEGKISLFRFIKAKDLWKKILTRLFETGHPWITFKDSFNVRSPQDHVGIIHSSNLCTEIGLNTSNEETAVCNLGSINLAKHIKNGKLDINELEKSVKIAIRMLDNIIDLNFYPIKQSEVANKRHRPIGLGLMGFQDALFMMDINFSSKDALEFADYSMELISYYAIEASSEIASEKGQYSTYKGSKWDKGIFPIDTIDMLEKERQMAVEVERKTRLDWQKLKNKVKKYGLRNSNLLAIAPTATISTISGCYPCIEPIYENIYVESNLSGEFTIINKYLVDDLKNINLWSKDMLDKIKYYDGDINNIDEIPAYIKEKYKTVFELDSLWLIDIAAARGKWIDQSQSYNIFMKGTSGIYLHDIYIKAWKSGLKSTYYLRSLAASQIEKSTLDTKYGYTQKRQYSNINCSINNPADCQSCQ